MKIYLCRHGETDYNKNKIIMGHLSIPLNKKGKEQAIILAKELEDKRISAIYSSDLLRAKETTDIINEVLNVPVSYVEGLREHSMKIYDGMRVDEFLSEYNTMEKFDNLMKEVGAETTLMFVDRVWGSFQEIIKGIKNQDTILILTHGGAIRSIISKILDSSAIIFDNLKQDNCCINEITYTNENNQENFLIESVNIMCHFK